MTGWKEEGKMGNKRTGREYMTGWKEKTKWERREKMLHHNTNKKVFRTA